MGVPGNTYGHLLLCAAGLYCDTSGLKFSERSSALNTLDQQVRIFRERIRDHYSSLTVGYRRLADYLLENTFDAAFLNAGELARRASVDAAAVTRFAQALGYSGYQELASDIQAHVKEMVGLPAQRVRTAGEDVERLELVCEYAVRAVKQVLAADKHTLSLMAQTIRDSPRLWVSGEGIRLVLAQSFAGLVDLWGIPAQLVPLNLIDTALYLHKMTPDDTLFSVALNNPGIDSAYLLRAARGKGLRTLCLCGSATGAAAQAAELCVTVPARGALGMLSFAPAALLLNVVWETVTAAEPDKMLSHFVTIQDHLMNLINLRNEICMPDNATPQQFFGKLVDDPEAGL